MERRGRGWRCCICASTDADNAGTCKEEAWSPLFGRADCESKCAEFGLAKKEKIKSRCTKVDTPRTGCEAMVETARVVEGPACFGGFTVEGSVAAIGKKIRAAKSGQHVKKSYPVGPSYTVRSPDHNPRGLSLIHI